ncbi:hypothetical protein FHS91_001468 [Sphingobium xanthum]|uniref:hypothetical protein n=1 Tax=Sphingobium xanthum TaxID=1387165 RepID=UPI001C8BC769|nr:hypothetical protein [Sphingobium xanthum]
MDRKLRLARVPRGRAMAGLVGMLMLAPVGAQAQQAQPRLPYPSNAGSYRSTPQPDQRTDEERRIETAGDIAVQPVRDVGLTSSGIHPALRDAVVAPYKVPKRMDCRWLNWELARLNQALGPDFDIEDKPQEDKVERLAFAGGEMVVNSLIPFRGLVREISGAAPATGARQRR